METAGAAQRRLAVQLAIGIAAGSGIQSRVKLYIVRNEQVQKSIAVVINETAPGIPSGVRTKQASLERYIAKAALSEISVERILAPVSDEQIVESIVIEISHAAALTPAGPHEPGSGSHIGKGAVAIVMEQAACWAFSPLYPER